MLEFCPTRSRCCEQEKVATVPGGYVPVAYGVESYVVDGPFTEVPTNGEHALSIE